MDSNKSAAVVTKPAGDIMEAVIAKGDLALLTAEQRAAYYVAVCRSVGLNPMTQPFQYINLNGKLTLYARKDATDQLRETRKVSIVKLEREKMEGLYVVTATAQVPDGRQDSSIGAVSIEGLKGDALANGIMKAETKAKRRVTLSICGLGWTDESEIETIPGAQPAHIDVTTGEVVEAKVEQPPMHWSDRPHNGQSMGAYWTLKAAEKRSLSTGQVATMLGDLHQFPTPEAAVLALDAKIAEAVK